MKTLIQKLTLNRNVVLLVCLMAAPAGLQAQPTAHYVPGVEGIKGASLPPPGVYFRDYNYFYVANRLNNEMGSGVPIGINAEVYANIPRLIWITDETFLGGNVGVDALLPLVYQKVNLNTPAFSGSSHTFGIGDFFAEGTLSWHEQQFDFSVGSGVHAPTGDSGGTRAGLGYWTFMQTAGATWFVDADKTWAVSALNRYEFNTEQRDSHITPGQAYTLEWAVSKTLAKVIDVGAVGYYQQQVTTDTGANASGSRDRVAAVGPEISVAFPSCMTFVSLRYNYEFMAEDRTQGHAFTLTLTKRF